MPKKRKRFCQLLDELIQEKKITKVKFYTELGIKKPYFYDIISGNVSPPPPERQLDMIRILRPSPEKMIEFFNIAAAEREEIPVDIAMQLTNKQIVEDIRKSIDYEELLKTGDNNNEW